MPIDPMQLFPLALIKGLVEHEDSVAYFGSMGGFKVYQSCALSAGWIDPDGMLTPKGRQVYEDKKLSTLPREKGRRAYLWDWTKIPL